MSLVIAQFSDDEEYLDGRSQGRRWSPCVLPGHQANKARRILPAHLPRRMRFYADRPVIVMS